MKYVKSVIVLTGICLAAALLLSFVNAITRDAIAANEKKDALRSVEKVLPEYDNNLEGDVLEMDGVKIYRGFKGGEFAGVAIQTGSSNGYGGTIKVMTGIDAHGRVLGMEVVAHAETPGLGTKVMEDVWKSQLFGKGLDSGAWQVRKDNPHGVVDEVTGATISSRAITEAVSKALEVFDRNSEKIMAGGK